jgi:hypothetical protein
MKSTTATTKQPETSTSLLDTYINRLKENKELEQRIKTGNLIILNL